jgi:hypothetical protein
MDWTNIVNGLGNFGDIASGHESYNSIKRGNQNYALAQDTLAQHANLQAQQMALHKAMQDAEFNNRAKLQDSSQRFQGDQNFFNRATNTYENNADRIMRMSEGSANRTAHQQAVDAQLQNTVDLAKQDQAFRSRPIGSAGSLWGMDPNIPADIAGHVGGLGAAMVGQERYNLENRKYQGTQDWLNQPKSPSLWEKLFGRTPPSGTPVNGAPPATIKF